jgi:hypothetical protein
MNLPGLFPLWTGYVRRPLNGWSSGADDADMQRPTVTRPSAADIVGGLVLLTIAALMVVVALFVAAG